jgi:hypothetical protein
MKEANRATHLASPIGEYGGLVRVPRPVFRRLVDGEVLGYSRANEIRPSYPGR